MSSHARYLCAVLVSIQILSGNLAVFSARDKDDTKKTAAFTFVKADNKPIDSLVDLKDGVYSISLFGGRANCGFSASSAGTIKLVHTPEDIELYVVLSDHD